MASHDLILSRQILLDLVLLSAVHCRIAANRALLVEVLDVAQTQRASAVLVPGEL